MRTVGSYFHILNSELLSEIFQEAVVRLWRNITSGKLTEQTLTTSLEGYLFSVGKNAALEIFRREGINVNVSVDEMTDAGRRPLAVDPSWDERETEQQAMVRRTVYQMGEPCAPLLLSFYWDKLSWEEIASRLHYKDANSAKTQKYKCLQKIKAQILNTQNLKMKV